MQSCICSAMHLSGMSSHLFQCIIFWLCAYLLNPKSILNVAKSLKFPIGFGCSRQRCPSNKVVQGPLSITSCFAHPAVLRGVPNKQFADAWAGCLSCRMTRPIEGYTVIELATSAADQLHERHLDSSTIGAQHHHHCITHANELLSKHSHGLSAALFVLSYLKARICVKQRDS